MSEKLKPCPFCEGTAETYSYETEYDIYDKDTLGYVDTEYHTKYGVGCPICGCIIGEQNSKEQAIAAWNNRANKNVKVVSLTDIYRCIAGHSNYHGDDILSALTCIAEGKKVNPVSPL